MYFVRIRVPLRQYKITYSWSIIIFTIGFYFVIFIKFSIKLIKLRLALRSVVTRNTGSSSEGAVQIMVRVKIKLIVAKRSSTCDVVKEQSKFRSFCSFFLIISCSGIDSRARYSHPIMDKKFRVSTRIFVCAPYQTCARDACKMLSIYILRKR